MMAMSYLVMKSWIVARKESTPSSKKLFEEAHSTICPPGNSAARRKRSTYYPQPFGLNTIWFQYHLCKDVGINCWFFTQGWNQGDFGSYYLYKDVLGSDMLDGDLDFTDLLLLSSLGGVGSHGVGGGRYRREADNTADDDEECDKDCRLCLEGKCQDKRDPKSFLPAITKFFQSLLNQAKATHAPAAAPGAATTTRSSLFQSLLNKFIPTTAAPAAPAAPAAATPAAAPAAAAPAAAPAATGRRRRYA